MNYRNQRLTKVFEEELSRIITKELEFSGALVTITSVQVNKKLDRADVNFSVFPPEKTDKVLEILNKEKNSLRRLLAKKIKMKWMLALEFKIDHGPENAAQVEKLLLKNDTSES